MPTENRTTEQPDEVKRYRFKGAAGEYIDAADYDAAQSELAALREELAAMTQERDYCKRMAVHNREVSDLIHQRLNAADQRSDELTAKPSDTERERLMGIVEQYPNGDPLEYNAARRKLQR